MFDDVPTVEPVREPIKPYRKKKPSGGTKPRHICPGCGKSTTRRIRRFPTLGYVDERCDRCADKIAAWPEQHTDPRRPDASVEESVVLPPGMTPL